MRETKPLIDWTAPPDPQMQEWLDAAPPFTDEQRTALAELLKPVRRISAADIAALLLAGGGQ